MVQQIEQTRRSAEMQKSQLVSQCVTSMNLWTHIVIKKAAVNDDPFDIEAQKRIEDAIRQENIAANLEAAMEYNPESFARVNIDYYLEWMKNQLNIQFYIGDASLY